jgi:hypothetical protein
MAIVFWIHYREGPWLVSIALHTGFVVVLFVAHLFALGIYGLTIGCYESSRTPGIVRPRELCCDGVSGIAAYLFWCGRAARLSSQYLRGGSDRS